MPPIKEATKNTLNKSTNKALEHSSQLSLVSIPRCLTILRSYPCRAITESKLTTEKPKKKYPASVKPSLRATSILIKKLTLTAHNFTMKTKLTLRSKLFITDQSYLCRVCFQYSFFKLSFCTYIIHSLRCSKCFRHSALL